MEVAKKKVELEVHGHQFEPDLGDNSARRRYYLRWLSEDREKFALFRKRGGGRVERMSGPLIDVE